MRALRLVVALSVLTVIRADAAVLCKTRSSALVVRDACRTKDTPFPVERGEQGSAGAPGAAGQAGRWPIRVLDAVGNEVGPAVYVEWYLALTGPSLTGIAVAFAVVQHAALAEPALLGIDVNGDAAGEVYYATNDCTGAPVVRGGGLIPVLHLIGDTVFVPGGPGSPSVASTEGANASGGCTSLTPRGGCCRPVTGPLGGPVAEATTLSLGTLGFTRPFHAVGP